MLGLLGYTPVASQSTLIGLLSSFLADNGKERVFILKGYAGTGKTTLIAAFVRALDLIGGRTVLLAPTGRAAKVLSGYAGKPAFTIHKKIYRQVSSNDGFGRFVADKNLHTNTTFIVDEASMITGQTLDNAFFGSGSLLADLLSYVTSGRECRLVLVGDTAQLPPVGYPLSPALDSSAIARYGIETITHELADVIRQAGQSGILSNATRLRELINAQPPGGLPGFVVANKPDIVRLSGEEVIDQLQNAYNHYQKGGVIIINRSNKLANRYNVGIRAQIFGYDEEILRGDLLMVVKNNYHWLGEAKDTEFIANGDIIEVERIHRYHQLYGFRFADARIRLVDADIVLETKLLLDTLGAESAALTSEQNKQLFYAIYEDFSGIKPRKKGYDMVRGNDYFNALQVKFAYAVTCHKAQGGQWGAVFIDQGYIGPEKCDMDHLRWLYTAITRATEKVYLVNFPDNYFR